MYKISKKFEFCYGHRVWTQSLSPKFSLDSKCGCRALHGHNGIVEIILKGESLDIEKQMLVDFKELNWFKKILDDYLDHKFIFDIKDPLIKILFTEINFETGEGLIKDKEKKLWTIDLEFLKNEPQKVLDCYIEYLGGIVFVEFCPTSENLSKWFCDLVSSEMRSFINIQEIKVIFSETSKSQATYYE